MDTSIFILFIEAVQITALVSGKSCGARFYQLWKYAQLASKNS